jgi:hypothetical protein
MVVLGWLLVSHLTADFILQTDSSVADRNGSGLRAWRALGLHGLVVGASMAPFWLAFGTPGLVALLVIAVPHPFIDAAKTRLTQRARAGANPADWLPVPACLFLVDQAVHLTLMFGAWWLLLRDATLNPWFADRMAQATAGASAADIHRAALIAIVVWSLAVINGRAARYFVPLLLPPEAATGTAEGAAAATAGPHQAVGYSVKLGPVSGRIEPDRAPAIQTSDNVGAVVGVIERLLVLILVFDHAEFAIGLVIAAKTLARFKQLDERPFAEKYLVGTLASVTVAVASALIGRTVLGG